MTSLLVLCIFISFIIYSPKFLFASPLGPAVQVNITDFPFYTIIGIRDISKNLKSNAKFFGGVILSKEWILTQSRDLNDSYNFKKFVISGKDKYDPGSLKNSISPMSIECLKEANLCMIKLNRNLTFSDKIKSIKIPRKYEERQHGQGHIIDFRYTKVSGGKTTYNEKTNLSDAIYSLSDFHKCYQDENFWKDSIGIKSKSEIYCTSKGPKPANNIVTCHNLGSPLVGQRIRDRSYVLLGLVIYDPCKPNGNGLIGFTRVSRALEWIRSTMKNSSLKISRLS